MHSPATTTPTDSAPGTIPSPEIDNFLNSPQRCVKEIRNAQKIIQEKMNMIKELKMELEIHLGDGTISEQFKVDNIKATRVKSADKWAYSEEGTQKIKYLEDKIAFIQREERESGDKAVRIPGNYYWRIS